ncbi:MAG: hypothetical protein U0X92_13005 [Anaerolineales bacterium]
MATLICFPTMPASAFETVKGFEGVTAVAFDGRSFDELIINDVSKITLTPRRRATRR